MDLMRMIQDQRAEANRGRIGDHHRLFSSALDLKALFETAAADIGSVLPNIRRTDLMAIAAHESEIHVAARTAQDWVGRLGQINVGFERDLRMAFSSIQAADVACSFLQSIEDSIKEVEEAPAAPPAGSDTEVSVDLETQLVAMFDVMEQDGQLIDSEYGTVYPEHAAVVRQMATKGSHLDFWRRLLEKCPPEEASSVAPETAKPKGSPAGPDEKVRAAFQEQREAIAQGEEYLVRFIRGYLLTDTQKKRLTELDLDVADLINGRYPIDADELHSWFIGWNDRLGEDYFLK